VAANSPVIDTGAIRLPYGQEKQWIEADIENRLARDTDVPSGRRFSCAG
jgi:hypothetical protein